MHGDLTHLLVNSAWFLAFGSPVARRTGAVRFLAFFLLCAIGGALFFFAVHPDMRNPMVGASGAISGLMGAAFRFMFGRSATATPRASPADATARRWMSLGATLTDRRILLAMAGWTLLNVVLAWGAAGFMEGGEHCLGGAPRGLLHGAPHIRAVRPAPPRVVHQ